MQPRLRSALGGRPLDFAAAPRRPPPPSAGWCGRSRSARAGGPRAGARIRSRSDPAATTTWAASAPKPGVTVQTWRSWTERTPSSPQIASPSASTSRPAGAASISTSTGSLIRRQDEARIRAAITRPTIGSTIAEPPARTKAPASDDAERAERVGDAVAQRPLEVDVLAAAAGEDDGRGDVAGEAEAGRARGRRRRRSRADRRAGRSRRSRWRSRRRPAAARWRAPRAPPSAGSRRCAGRRRARGQARRRTAPARSSRRRRAGARRRRAPPASR